MPPGTSSEDGRVQEEYASLLDRSQQLFSGLRDVPQFGKQWQPYFQRTFEVYTKLWKFQQVHRAALEASKERFVFKRYDIVHINPTLTKDSLRTSEPNYLNESFVFYEAIRTRGYFNEVLDAKTAIPTVKKLRYYARFIVVCLLLNKRELVETLSNELDQDVDLYVKTFRPTDNQEWPFVLHEISQFLKADNVLQLDNQVTPLHRRLSQLTPFSSGGSRIKVQEAILVGNSTSQVKFSELTLDMFRMMQSLEWEPQVEDPVGDTRDTKGRRNPHKYLLYRPTMSQLLLFLANSFKELQDNNVLLLYISADGIKQPMVNPSDAQLQLEIPEEHASFCKKGGVALNSRRSPEKQQSGITADCLYPEDLMMFTRKHLFIILDSNNSEAFSNIPSLFGKQVMCLMSPKGEPAVPETTKEVGHLFTLFLSDPVAAFCHIMEKPIISTETLGKLNQKKMELYQTLLQLIQSPGIDPAFSLLSQEEFLQRFILNYIFCVGTLRYHKQFRHPDDHYLPQIYPELPNELFHHRDLQSVVYDMAELLDASAFLVGEV